jgi:serine/threonine protein kinase
MADATYEIFPIKGKKIEIHSSLLELVGTGGVAKVFKRRDSDAVALKIYHSPAAIDWKKIEYQILNPIERHENKINKLKGFAWPLSIVWSNGKKVGIVLPYYDADYWISLDNWVEGRLLRNLSYENQSLSYRILILRNLAHKLAYAHAAKCSVIDLRPSNILVHNNSCDVCLIDCDSFRLEPKHEAVFPGSHVSAGYISPEALRTALDIPLLNENQDRYAYAVIAFQVLNYGIHPFQGILRQGRRDAETNDQKARLGLYAYKQPDVKNNNRSPVISPLPQSVHNAWPTDLRNLLDQALTKEARPTLRDWKRYFDRVIREKLLSRCDKHPSEVRHIRFQDYICGACHRQDAIRKIKPPEPSAIKSLEPKAISYSPVPKPPKSADNWFRFVVGSAFLFFGWLIFFSGSSHHVENKPSPLSVTPNAKLATEGEPSFKNSDRPDKITITALQQRLNWLGYNAGVPDGIVGSKTRSAIQELQEQLGIIPDGLASELLLKKAKDFGNERLYFSICNHSSKRISIATGVPKSPNSDVTFKGWYDIPPLDCTTSIEAFFGRHNKIFAYAYGENTTGQWRGKSVPPEFFCIDPMEKFELLQYNDMPCNLPFKLVQVIKYEIQRPSASIVRIERKFTD